MTRTAATAASALERAVREDGPRVLATLIRHVGGDFELAEDALQDAYAAAVVAWPRDGEVALTDGPFAETKEVLGGYYVIDVADLDEAAKWAAKMPLAPYGSVEIRPLMEFDRP